MKILIGLRNALVLMAFVSFSKPYEMPIIQGDSTYSVVKYDENGIRNMGNLKVFYQLIDQYVAGKKDKLIITHIGDSHIQADYLTQQTRVLFQKTFGNGGRGFVFPCRVVRTNGPLDVGLSYGGEWESCRSVLSNADCKFGICGITATTFDRAAYIKMDPNNLRDMNYEFDRLKIFHMQSPGSFDIDMRNPDSSKVSFDIQPVSESVSDVFFEELQDSMWMSFVDLGPQEYFQLYGMSFENNHRGLVYNAIGQNGAFVKSYLRNTFFEEQMSALNSDLVVVSLGTNDGYMSEGMFCTDCFKENYRKLLNRIRSASPDAAILLTTPGDFYIRQRRHNSNIESMNEAIYLLSEEFGAAVWDFNKVMGGSFSMKKWNQEGLAQRDLVHFTEKGYKLQGQLLYDAIMAGYEQQFD